MFSPHVCKPSVSPTNTPEEALLNHDEERFARLEEEANVVNFNMPSVVNLDKVAN